MSILPDVEVALLLDDVWDDLDAPSITLNSESNEKPSLKLSETQINGIFNSNDGDLQIITSDVKFELMCNSDSDLTAYFTKFKNIMKELNKNGIVSAFLSSQDETNENEMSYKKSIIYKISKVI